MQTTGITDVAGVKVLELMAEVMAEVQKVEKGDTVTSGPARFNYRGVDRVVLALSAAIRKHKLVILPTVRETPEFAVSETSKGNRMNCARLLVEYTVYAPDGSNVAFSVPGEAFDSGDKSVAKAMSVAWRTGLLQAFFLPTGDPDPDSETYDAQPGRNARADAIDAANNARASWLAAIEERAGDYSGLLDLYNQAKKQGAPQPILAAITEAGKKANSNG